MKKNTDLKNIRDMAECFLRADIYETRVPFVASHPFTSSWTCFLKNGSTVRDLHDNEVQVVWREKLSEQIKKSDLFQIFMMLNKAYILNFLKFSAKYMSNADLGMILSGFWTTIEQISLDDSVTTRDIVNWFSRADKKTLMDDEERKILNELPDEVTIYRGVTSYNKRRKKAFSWTTDKTVAEWFANRFQTGTGEIWTLTVPKDRILCVFEERNEHEVIVNLCGYDKEPVVEVLSVSA